MHNSMKDLKDLFRTSCQLSKSMKIEAVTEENPTPDDTNINLFEYYFK